MSRALHPPAVVAAVRAAYRRHDGHTGSILADLRVSHPTLRRSQVSHLLARVRAGDDGNTGGDESPAVAEWQARRDAAEREIEQARARDAETRAHLAERLDWLRPVELPAPPVPDKPRVRSTPRTLIAGDFHFPHQDDAAVAVFLQAVAALRPERVILNGDTLDLLAVSKYPKDARHGYTWKLRDEVAAFHAFLHRLHAIGDAWGLEVIETEANHSGNGTASRWWRYLSDRVPELLGHDDAEARLSYAEWMFPKWSNIRLAEQVVIADDLVVMHGDLVRGQAAYSARGHVVKYQASVLHNHTHRAGFSPHRLPAIDGLRGESLVRGYENGCMCRLDPVYGKGLNWQQGFSVVSHDEATGSYGVEQVIVHDGRAVVNAVGGLLAA